VTAKKQAQKWLGRSYDLWTQWTSYLVDYSLRPDNQLSTDDFAGWLALQTNLALKGIVGIKAMSELANVMGKDKDVEYYRNISSVYVEKWEEYGMSRDGGRAKLAYDWHGSWTTLYSLYADAILCFHPTFTDNSTSTSSPGLHTSGEQTPIIDHPNKKTSKDFIPDHIYQTQSEWYLTAMQKYGVSSESFQLKQSHSCTTTNQSPAPSRLAPLVHKVRLGVPGCRCRIAQDSHSDPRACGQMAERNGV
jgi:hypothetical protein